jgi:hypothetical protein
MLIYKLPPDRSTRRVYVWRRLKRIGAIYLQDGTCLLPANDRTREQFQWLAAEIVEMTGEAYICRADFLTGDQEARVIEQFREQARAAYQQALASLGQPTIERQAGLQVEVALKEAWSAFGAARQIDFFSVPEGDLALKRLRELAQDVEDSRREGE